MPVVATGLQGNGIPLEIPIGKSLGPVRLLKVLLNLDRDTGGSEPKTLVQAALSFSTQIGPVVATIDRIGMKFGLDFPEDRSQANLHFANLDLGFIPPKGIGLVVDAKSVKGGGFLFHDEGKHQYAGVMELSLSGVVALKAIGLLATRLPDGSKGYSLLILVTAQSAKPGGSLWELPLGWRLTGLGGLIAIHRTVDEDAVRAGLKNHTLESILFPKDPVANAPTVLAAIDRVFPARRGSYLFGLMVQLQWGVPTLIEVNLGLIVELGGRNRFVVLGRRSPPFCRGWTTTCCGSISTPSASSISIRAPRRSTRCSSIASAAPLSAHRRRRAACALDFSAQLRPRGRRAASRLHAAGRLSHGGTPRGQPDDRRQPAAHVRRVFRLDVEHRAVRCARASVRVRGGLQHHGRRRLRRAHPAPAVPFPGRILRRDAAQEGFDESLQSEGRRRAGRAAATVGAREVHVRDSVVGRHRAGQFHAGERTTPPLPAAIDAFAQLRAVLGDAKSWTTELPLGQTRIVSLRESAADGTLRVHPLGTLTVRQSVVPLNLTRDIDKFNDSPIAGVRRFTVTRVVVGTGTGTEATGPVQDDFAPAQFFQMSDDEKLAAPRSSRCRRACGSVHRTFAFRLRQRVASPLELRDAHRRSKSGSPAAQAEGQLPH